MTEKTYTTLSFYFILLGRVHEDEQSAGPSGTGASARKKARLDPLPNGSNAGGANGAANSTSGALLGNLKIKYKLSRIGRAMFTALNNILLFLFICF